jgi:hypothetical protein
MQKEHRWSVAFVKDRDGRSAGANLSLHKAGKKNFAATSFDGLGGSSGKDMGFMATVCIA